MINLTHNENKRLTTLISGGYLLLVSILAIVFLNGAPATTVQADSHCGEDVCQNDSAQFTINMQPVAGEIDNFYRQADSSGSLAPVYINEDFTLVWNTTDADEVEGYYDSSYSGSSGWSGVKSENGSQNLSESSSGTYTYRLRTLDVNDNVTDTDQVTVNIGVRPPVIDSFSSNKSEVEENEPFSLSWATTNAGSVEAFGEWSGSLSSDGTRSGMSEPTAGTYTYGLRAYDAEGNNPDEETRQITVVEPPRYHVSFNPDPVDLDGEPGSTASIDLTLTAENGYDGEIDLSIVDVEPPINTSSGDRIDFTFSDDSPTVTAPGSETVTIDMETLQPIRQDTPYEVTVRSEDTTNTAETPNKETVFEINAEGFSPRTIEEF